MGNNLNKPLKVGATIGIIGGGQLGRFEIAMLKNQTFDPELLEKIQGQN